jgi:hypothetical protein
MAAVAAESAVAAEPTEPVVVVAADPLAAARGLVT